MIYFTFVTMCASDTIEYGVKERINDCDAA